MSRIIASLPQDVNNMGTKARYWKVSLPESMKEAIEDLFNENKDIRKLYSSNPVEFVRAAVREKIDSQRKLYRQISYHKEAATISG